MLRLLMRSLKKNKLKKLQLVLKSKLVKFMILRRKTQRRQVMLFTMLKHRNNTQSKYQKLLQSIPMTQKMLIKFIKQLLKQKAKLQQLKNFKQRQRPQLQLQKLLTTRFIKPNIKLLKLIIPLTQLSLMTTRRKLKLLT